MPHAPRRGDRGGAAQAAQLTDEYHDREPGVLDTEFEDQRAPGRTVGPQHESCRGTAARMKVL